MKTLEQIAADVARVPYFMPKDVRWQLCGECKLAACDPKAPGCQCREWNAARQRAYYHQQREAILARQRARNADPERRAKNAERHRKYRQECADALKLKRRLNSGCA